MADSSVAITAGTGTPIRVLTGLGTGSADQQVVTLADSAGNLLGTTAAPFPVTIGADPDTVATGTISATDAVVAAPGGAGVLLTGTPTANSSVSVVAPGGDSAWAMQFTGTFGGGTVYFEASFDGGTNWIAVEGRQTGILTTNLNYFTTTAGLYRGNTAAATNLRARIVGATSPSVAVTIHLGSGMGALFLNAALPPGTSAIGQLTPSSLVVTATAAAAAAVTATLPAAGAGLFHYITNIRVERFCTAATTGANSGFLTGGTNHSLVFQLPSDTQAIGFQSTPVDYRPTAPLRSTAANTATTVTTPVVTATIYRVTVTYYTGA